MRFALCSNTENFVNVNLATYWPGLRYVNQLCKEGIRGQTKTSHRAFGHHVSVFFYYKTLTTCKWAMLAASRECGSTNVWYYNKIIQNLSDPHEMDGVNAAEQAKFQEHPDGSANFIHIFTSSFFLLAFSPQFDALERLHRTIKCQFNIHFYISFYRFVFSSFFFFSLVWWIETSA